MQVEDLSQADPLITAQAHKMIGLTGLSVLDTILKEERGEKDVLRGALECLNNALAAPVVSRFCLPLNSETTPHRHRSYCPDKLAGRRSLSGVGMWKAASMGETEEADAMQDGKRQSAAAMNAELFCREDDSIASIFTILAEETDFYCRYHAVRLLTALSTSSTQRLAQVT